MLSLILGFASSVVPKVLDLFKEDQDRKHELALMDRQLEIQRQIEAEKTTQVKIKADTEMYQADSSAFEAAISAQTEAVQVDGVANWAKTLNAAVRPLLGTAVVAFIGMGLLSVWFAQVAVAFNALCAIPVITEMLMFILAYFMGNRSLGKPLGKQ